MQKIKYNKCEKCSMVGTYSENIDSDTHYFCEHHKTGQAIKVLNVPHQSTFKKLLPLISMFGVIAVLTAVTMYIKQDYSFMTGMMSMMAYFFLVFGLFKLSNLSAFADAYMTYDILAKKSRTYALLYPFIEIGLGVLYFFVIGGIYRDLFTFIIMSIGTIGVWKALQNKDEIPCACLGTVFSVPMTKVTLFENLFMALMALYMVVITLSMGHMAM
jgi:hypothetical protein